MDVPPPKFLSPGTELGLDVCELCWGEPSKPSPDLGNDHQWRQGGVVEPVGGKRVARFAFAVEAARPNTLAVSLFDATPTRVHNTAAPVRRVDRIETPRSTCRAIEWIRLSFLVRRKSARSPGKEVENPALHTTIPTIVRVKRTAATGVVGRVLSAEPALLVSS